MRIHTLIAIIWACLLPVLTSCNRPQPLPQREDRAENIMTSIAHNIEQGNMDSIRALSIDETSTAYYIFYNYELVYWSSNHFDISQIQVHDFTTWKEYDLVNARCECRWLRTGQYTILALIPVERHHNGNFDPKKTFSYRAMAADNEEESAWDSNRFKAKIYYRISIALVILIVLIGIIGIIRARGFRNMRLLTKFHYLIMTLVLFSFLYVFTMSIFFVSRTYKERQRHLLEQKAEYIQAALREIYDFSLFLTPANTGGLNIDLADLSYTYEIDIHVYDLDGRLIGTSTPQLFEHGLLTPYMSPKPFFSSEPKMVMEEELDGKKYLTAYTDFYNSSFVRIGYITVPSFISSDELTQETDNYLARLLPFYIIALFLAWLVSMLIARSMTSPLSAIAEKMNSFELGKDNHIIYDQDDEIGYFVSRYNALVDQLEISANRLARSEREGAWRTMARQIAHEINNPLTSMKLTIQQLQRLKGTERFDEMFPRASVMLVEQMDNLSRIATSFSSFAKLPQVVISTVDIAERLTQSISLLNNNPENIPIRYVGPDKGIYAETDKEQIGQVFTNILRNAIQALSGRANSDIIVILRDAAPDNKIQEKTKYIEISISDNGPGISSEIQPKIFMPNFTTKSTGTGLGLAISKNIVEGSGGKICFETSEKGTTFFVYLPKKG